MSPFIDLEHRQTVSYTGDSGVQAIIAQFHDTPIAAVYEDIPEDDITGERLYRLVQNQLNGHIQLIRLEKYRDDGIIDELQGKQVAWYREANDIPFYPTRASLQRFNLDRSKARVPDVRAVAQPLRETIAQLVPAIQGTQLDDIEVWLTPVVESEEQLILYEHREQRFVNQAAQSGHVIVVDEEQYTVFERDATGVWQCRGTLPFYTRSEFADDPETLYVQMDDDYSAKLDEIHARLDELEEQGRSYHELYTSDEFAELHDPLIVPEPRARMTVKEKQPYPAVIFNQPATEQHTTQAYKTITTRRIYATLPEELTFEPPTPEDFEDEEEEETD